MKIQTIASLLLIVFLTGCSSRYIYPEFFKDYEKSSVGNRWEAGVAKVDITPRGRVYMGGFGDFGQQKESLGVNDPLSARCLVLSNGVDNLTIISLDLLGLFENDINRIKSFVKSNNVIVSVTHTHSGPDTVGIWSRNGRDEGYMKFLFDKIDLCVYTAILKRKPVEISLQSYQFSNKSKFRTKQGPNHELVDKNATAMIGVDKSGENLFVLLNFAVHPHLVNTRKISADFLSGFYHRLENDKKFKAAIFLNGGQGNVSPEKKDYPFKYGSEESYQAAFNYGRDLADLLIFPEKLPLNNNNYSIQFKRSYFRVKLENRKFKEAERFGLVPKMVDREENVEIEVNYIKLGNLGIVTIPGEAFPNIAKILRSEMGDEFKIICGLCNGAYGYIMLPEDYPNYDYHRSMSVGPTIGNKVIENLKKLLK